MNQAYGALQLIAVAVDIFVAREHAVMFEKFHTQDCRLVAAR